MVNDEATGNDRREEHGALIKMSGTEPRNIMISLDGSRRAVRAILPARRLAAALGLPVGVITVSDADGGLDQHELEVIQADNRLHWTEVVRSPDAAAGISASAREHDAIIVMATGGRGRSVAIVGSTATDVVKHSNRPVMLIGRGTEVFERRPIRGLVVGVNGRTSGESICAPAVDLAVAHGFDLDFVTVAQPIPEAADPQNPSARRFGPPGDVDAYMSDLVDRYARPGLALEGSVVYDPLNPAGGLAQMMRWRPQSILVLGTKSRTGLARLRHGSVASRIVSESPVPSLMLPILPRDAGAKD